MKLAVAWSVLLLAGVLPAAVSDARSRTIPDKANLPILAAGTLRLAFFSGRAERLASLILTACLVLLFVFRNGFLPFILVLTIETAIWCNLSIPYHAGTELQYIGYLVISSIMLGATVDYTIIMAKSYESISPLRGQPAPLSQAISGVPYRRTARS